MTTLCFAKAYHPGKLTFSSLRHCSSISQSLKTEAGGSTVIKESYSPSVSLDIPPVLFIAKYNRLIETSDFSKTAPPNQPKEDINQETLHQQQHQQHQQQLQQQQQNEKEDRFEENNWSPQSLTQRKIRFILEAVKNTKTFESLSERLTECPLALFEAPSKAVGSGRFRDYEFVDDEKVGSDLKAEERLVLQSTQKSGEDELLQWTKLKLDLRKLPTYYLMLSKFRLTMLVCATSAGGFCLAPVDVFDPYVLALSTLGVGFISASANTVNQFLEVPFDSQMNRTKNRVLVRGLLMPRHALTFAAMSGVTGTLILVNYANPLAAGLGLFNLFLYTSVYTPMKRVTVANTWVGSLVGAIPPLIGWASATGSLNASAFVLGGILFAWQFPHFNSLSWNLRPDYSKAGYRMMSVTNPDLCKRVALRYSVACIGICSLAAPLLEVTSWAFALDTLPLNGYLTFLAWKFYQKADSNSSRKLFRFTLIHLPLLMTLMFINRKKKIPSDSSDQVLNQVEVLKL